MEARGDGELLTGGEGTNGDGDLDPGSWNALTFG